MTDSSKSEQSQDRVGGGVEQVQGDIEEVSKDAKGVAVQSEARSVSRMAADLGQVRPARYAGSSPRGSSW